ncbi:MAG: DsbA family protein [Haloferacaceae archaeon]
MQTTRRAYLAAVGGTATALAGCLSGSGSGCDAKSESPVDSLPVPVLGDPDADVTVQVFEDFACPHCMHYELEQFPKVRSEYVDPGTIRYERHDYPIPVSKWSWPAASAARGVQDETDVETFYEYAHAVYENQSDLSLDTLQSLADEVGAPACDVREDADTGTYRPVVEADKRRGDELGVPGTPAVFVDGQLLRSYAYDSIRSAIEQAQ